MREGLWPHEGGGWGLPAMGSFPVHPWIGNFRSQTILQFSKLWDFWVWRQESCPSDSRQTHSPVICYIYLHLLVRFYLKTRIWHRCRV